jgi:NOL1/NOP2/fmu family ribosome biogenesis protein
MIGKTLKVVYEGIPVGEVKGKDILPHHALAMSSILNRDSFPLVELTYDQAISYLRKEAIVLDSSVPKGMVLMTYRQTPLGFVKNIGNRANNLYPNEWRIRSGITPSIVSSFLL